MTCTEPIALLRRSDGDIYCYYSGPDWQAKSEALSAGHCLAPILVAPGALAGAQQQINAALKQSNVGAGWFSCPVGVAVGALAA
eukprot:9685956-Karenia_brevis.AAC.1